MAEIDVLSRTQKIIVDSRTSIRVVDAGPVGPRGATGATGAPGAASSTFMHVQNAPATTWEVQHDLGFYPSVQIIDSGGSVHFGSVTHIDLNSLEVTFSSAFSGTAALS